MGVLNGSGPGHVDSPAQLYILWMGMREVAVTISVDRVKAILANGGQQSPHSSMAKTKPYSKLGSTVISLHMRNDSI